MSVIQSTTGHNPVKEKSIARILYVCLAVAVVIGVAAAMLAGRNNASLDPKSSDSVQQVAPDAGVPPTSAQQ